MGIFQITSVIKGKTLLGENKRIKAAYYGEQEPGSLFYLAGEEPPELIWGDPIYLDKASKTYVDQIVDLTDEPVERLKFFQKHLEHENEMIARDAYDEFARAPYKDVLALKDSMDLKQIIEWVNSESVPSSRRRLYFMLLGVCGTKKQLPAIEKMLRNQNPKEKTGVDAMIACYLTLAGEKGLPLIEELFMKPKDTEYTDVYSAVMAIRFHGTDSDVIPRKKLLPLLHHLLDRPRLADLVIPDLARWDGQYSIACRIVQRIGWQIEFGFEFQSSTIESLPARKS